MRMNQKGFSAVILLLSIVALGLAAFDGWLVYDKYIKEDTSTNKSAKETGAKQDEKVTSETEVRKEFKLENEGLSFSYNPKLTTFKTDDTDDTSLGGPFTERVIIQTGSVKLTVSANVDGIGGGPGCMNEGRESCAVVDTKRSIFLGEITTYRLVKTNRVASCGYSGVPNCDVAPLEEGYIIDTSDSTEEFGGCCGTIIKDSKNTGRKSPITGALLISIEPSVSIFNQDLFQNTDFLETIKIIESMRY